MRQRRFIRILLGSGLVLSFGIWGRYIVSTSTTMGTTTELAGISYTLDQYCSVQTGGNQSDPEAIVAFEDTTTNTDGTTVVSGTAVGGATPQPTEQATATATPKPESEYANVGISIAADYVNIRKKPSTEAEIIGKLYRGSAATIRRRCSESTSVCYNHKARGGLGVYQIRFCQRLYYEGLSGDWIQR